MIEPMDQDTAEAVNKLMFHYNEKAMALVDKMTNSYEEPLTSDLEELKSYLDFTSRLRFWATGPLKVSLFVSIRDLDNTGLAYEFNFKTEYANGHRVFGGLINHGGHGKSGTNRGERGECVPRWSAHT